MRIAKEYAATIKARKGIAADVLNTARFREQLVLLRERLGLPLAKIEAEAKKGLQEIVSVKNAVFSYLFDHVLGPMHTRAWTLDVDQQGLDRLKELSKSGAVLVYLPTHRSYADAFVLTQILRQNGMPRNSILGGNNVGFFPLGTIIRRSGGVLIRRSFKEDEIYKLVVREYLRYLVASGSNLEWYMEGGRSRTGKLRPPKYGLLRYLVDAIESGGADDLLLVPVSTTYDQLHEVGLMASEEAGQAKSKEGIRWLIDYARVQQKWIGKAYVRFGQAMSLRQALGHATEGDGGRWAVQKVAFEVFKRINCITPVTAPALVTLALLGVRDRALTLKEVHDVVVPLLEYASQRDLPTSAVGGLRDVSGVEEVLDALEGSGVVERYDAGLQPVFKIRPGKHAVAAFYRNSAIHWFVNRAIVELTLLEVSAESDADSLQRAWTAAYALRDLLKFEFFFSDKQAFGEEIRQEALLLSPGFRELVASPRRASILQQAPFLVAHRVLPAFFGAYFIVADRLAAQPVDATIQQAAFLEECVAVGRQYVLQQRLNNPECVSRELFANALLLAGNRGLLETGSNELAENRERFAAELAAAVNALTAIDEYDQHRRIDIGSSSELHT
jgi:glycerol-3-phosphate O-acyltransferase